MIDAVIKTALQSGLASIVATPALIDDAFRNEDPALRTRIKAWVGQKLASIPVQLGFYAGEASAPAICLHIPKAEESRQYLGSTEGDYYDENGEWVRLNTVDSDGYHDYQTTNFQASLEMAIISRNTDETIWLADLVIYILLRIRKQLEAERGVVNQSIAMQDVLIDSQYTTADPIWARAITLRYEYEHGVRVDSTDPDDTLVATGFTVSLTPL